MGYWFGDASDPLNVPTETWAGTDTVATGPGALQLFGVPTGSAAGSLLGGLGRKGRAVLSVGSDLASGDGPGSTVVEETTGFQPGEIFDNIAQATADGTNNNDGNGNSLPWYVYGLGLLVVLFLLAPYAELGTAALGGTE